MGAEQVQNSSDARPEQENPHRKQGRLWDPRAHQIPKIAGRYQDLHTRSVKNAAIAGTYSGVRIQAVSATAGVCFVIAKAKGGVRIQAVFATAGVY